MNKKVFVDGLTGTTGLKIHERLSLYKDIELLTIAYEKRREPSERARCLNSADVVFLCLPDDAAIEAVSLIENPETKVIDASTAHRIHKDWAYGIPELSNEHRDRIKNSKRVTVPGCYASAFVLPIYPLIQKGIIQPNMPLTCQGVSGYSGAGKTYIEKCEENAGRNLYTKAPRPYAFTLNHKHLPEMKLQAGLEEYPVFTPIVAQNNQGLIITIPINTKLLQNQNSAKEIYESLATHYAGEKFVRVMPFNDEQSLFEGGLDIEGCNNTNRADIYVYGNTEKNSALIVTRLDNLGKGASGAAIQNMNLMLGYDEWMNLIIN